MINAIDTALTGLNKASQQVNKSATKIVRGTSVNAQPQSQPTQNTNIPSTAPQNITTIQDVDVTAEIVNIKLAEISYKANLSVIETAGELFDELLNAFDDKNS